MSVCRSQMFVNMRCRIHSLYRLRHICWVKSGHGLTSPRLVRLLIISCLMSCFFSLVTILGLGVPLLRGTLPLRYCTSRFAHKVPTWSLPISGGVALLVSSGHGGGMLVRSDPSSPDPGRLRDRSGVPRSGL